MMPRLVAARSARRGGPPRRLGAARIVAAALVVAVVGGPASPARADGPQITGSGSSFVGNELKQWTADVNAAPYNLSVVYNATSSGQGRDEFANKSRIVDFAISDIPYPKDVEAQVSKDRGGFAYVPVSAGGMAFMFNLRDASGRRITRLNLTPTTACKIFTGQITKWTDPAITADNAALTKANLLNGKEQIKVVLRGGAAGTSYIFGQYCLTLAPDVWNEYTAYFQKPANSSGRWVNFPGPPLSQWQVPNTGATAAIAGSSDGNADLVANDAAGANSVALVETGFALSRSFPVAAVSSASHPDVFVRPTNAAVTKALSFATADPSKPTLQILNFDPGDAGAYNPSTYSYAITPITAEGLAADRGAVLAKFLYYCVTVGQEKAIPLAYAPLPQNLIDLGLDLVAKVNGAPARPSYTINVNPAAEPDPVAEADPGPPAGNAGGDPGTSNTTAAAAGGSNNNTSGSGPSSAGGVTGGNDANATSGGVDPQVEGATVDNTGAATGASSASGGASPALATPGAAKSGAAAAKAAAKSGKAGGGAVSNDPLRLPLQTPASQPASDSLIPLGWVAALGIAGYLASTRRSRSPQ